MLETLRERLRGRVFAMLHAFVADKPALRTALRAMWRTVRMRGWGVPRTRLDYARRTLNAARPLHKQASSWASATDQSVPISTAELMNLLSVCRGSVGVIVAVSHDDYALVFGGIQNVVADEQRAFEEKGWRYLHVAPAAPLPLLGTYGTADSYRLRLRLDGLLLGVVTFPVLTKCLLELRDQQARIEIVFHHLKGHVPEYLATWSSLVDIQPIFWIHDFFSVCPSFNLLRNGIKYCGGPPLNSPACIVCVFGDDRRDHSPRLKAFFDTIKPVVLAPSEVFLNLWLQQVRYFSGNAKVVPIAHLTMDTLQDPIVKKACRPLRVAHIGASITPKGWDIFEELTEKFAGDRRYKFYQIGADGVFSSKYTHVSVRVTPQKRGAMVEEIIRRRIDIVICWSIWPEAFCFTVHEALAAGAFVIASTSAGNIWPAVEAHAPGQGHSVKDEADLFQLFETGEVQERFTRARRFRGILNSRRNTADFLLTE